MTYSGYFANTFLIAFAFFTTASDAAAQQLLKWKFAKGDRFDIKVIQTTETETTVGEKRLSLVIQTAMWIQWQTKSVDADGHATLSHRFTRLATKTTSPDGKHSFFDTARADSQSDGVNATLKAVRPLLNSRALITMAPWGEIEKVELSGQTRSLLGDIPALSQIKKLLTTEGINQTLRQSFGVFPAAEVDPGDAWHTKTEIESPGGPIHMSSQFTFKGPVNEDGSELQKVESVTQIQLPVDTEDRPAAKSKPVTQTGSYWFDAARGHLAKSRLEQSIESDTSISENQAIHVTAKSTSVLEIVRR